MISRYLRAVAVWLSFGLALGVLLLVFFGNPLGLSSPQGAGRTDRLILLGGGGLLAFGVLLGAFSVTWAGTRFHERLVGFFSRGLNSLLLVVIVICATRVLLAIIPGFAELALADFLDRVFGPAWSAGSDLAARIGTPPRLGSVPTAPIVMGALFILGRTAVSWGAREIAPQGGEDRGLELPSGGSRGRAPDPERERRAQMASRRVAVASYTEAKAILATTQMELSFLALDIAGSTRIKQGEDPYVIEQSFADYRKLVERMLRRHGAYKQTWTPDGQMAAFRSPQSAIDAGRDILLALPDFNRNVSKMQGDFRLRVGANMGVVSVDDDIPMEEMSDFEIDVAGHMQKHADEDSFWIAEVVYQHLADKSGFVANGQEVDGRKVYVWKRPI